MREMVAARSSKTGGACTTATLTDMEVPGLRSTSGLPRVHVTLEQVEALPRRLDRIATGLRQVDRRLDQLHLRDIARAVGEDRARLHANDHLGADSLGKQGILARQRRGAVDAQTARTSVQIDEQQPDIRVD